MPETPPFEFLGYDFDQNLLRATFHYRGGTSKNPLDFTEIVDFSDRAPKSNNINQDALDNALFFAFIVIGTSYYKAFPTHKIIPPKNVPLFEERAQFFNTIYQDGLSQFAFENHLTRTDLAHFPSIPHLGDIIFNDEKYSGSGKLVLQSGGKDSLLTASLLNKSAEPWTAVYISSSDKYPKILDGIGANNLQIITRKIDHKNLKTATELGGLNGHVPVTYINIALALIQAILNNQNEIITSIGHEGTEPHAVIESPDKPSLPVNHQWSKTAEAEKLLQDYIEYYIAKEIKVHSLIRKCSELKVAEMFVHNCWNKFGHEFSSCNKANYEQGNDNSKLKWCGHCAKCANSYLLFAPFLEPAELDSLFPDKKSLFTVSELADDFKGLLGVDNIMKPFECVGEIAELRRAYHMKRKGYPDLPFSVPDSDFDYEKLY